MQPPVCRRSRLRCACPLPSAKRSPRISASIEQTSPHADADYMVLSPGWGKLFNGNLLVNACHEVDRRASAARMRWASRGRSYNAGADSCEIFVQLEVIADASNTARAHHGPDGARGDAGV